MNKKAFTLIELLAVIVILALMAIIVIPDILDTIDQSKEQNYQFLVNELENATKDYVKDHNQLQDVTSTVPVTITLQNLIDDNYFKNPVKDPRTNAVLSNTLTTVVVSLQSDGDLEYTVSLVKQ